MIVPTALVGAAVFATSATSGDCGPTELCHVQAIDGVVYARSDEALWSSADGGASWQSSELAWNDSRFDNDGREIESCVGERCSDIVRSTSDSSSRVVESVDRASTEILGFDLEQRREFGRVIQPSSGDESGSHLAAVDVAGGVHVVVAMGEAGTLYLAPDGVWEWVAVGPWGVDRSAASG